MTHVFGFLRATLLAALFLPLLSPLSAQNILSRAQKLAAAGRYGEAISLYSQVPEQSADYRAAQIGLGHTLAWKGRYEAAAQVFRRMLVKSPTDVEVEKGLGYVALWRGESGVAAGRFRRLAARFPEAEEYHTALGLSYLAEYRSKAARKEFDRALQLNPNSSARVFTRAADLKMGWIEADVWGSLALRDGRSRAGLRDVLLGWQLDRHFRLLGRYDNALATDYLALFPAAGGQAPAYTVGALADFKGIGISRVEVGGRSLPDLPDQGLVLLEHTYLFRKNAVLRGGVAGVFPDGQARQWTVYAGGRVPLGAGLAFEPAVYHTPAAGDKSASTRELLAINWRSTGGYALTAGFLLGRPVAEDPNLRDTWLQQRYLFALLPVSRPLWLMITLRDEPGLARRIFHVDLGIKWRIER